MTERTTVRLPDELIAQAKRKALVEGRSLTALIEESLRNAVAEPAPAPGLRPKPLPVSSARGGLAPGWNWDDLRKTDTDHEVERLRRSW